MAEVKWIKITTDMFEHDKIDFIESLPEADAILIIWIRLLTMAGKCNAGGYIFLTENIPYTEEMLAHKFRKPLNIVKLALTTLRQLNMIGIDDGGVVILNWEKYQNIDGLEKIREQNRLRKRRQREREQLPAPEEVTRDVTGQSQQSHATDIDIDKDKDLNKDIGKKKKYPDRVYELLTYWNNKGVVKHQETDTTLKAIENGLKKHSYEQIITAIDRYVTILNDTNYYYSHKWTLPKFLNQRNGVPEFLDEGQQWVNYSNQVKKGSTKVFDDSYQYAEREAPASDFFSWMEDGANET